MSNYKAEQQEYKLSLGSYWEGDNYIFIQDNGKQMDISTPNTVFQKIIKRYNETEEGQKSPLPLITLHGLRHTSATLLIASGIDPKTVQNRLGNSEISTTMDIYSHALRKQDEEAAEMIGKTSAENFKKQEKIICFTKTKGLIIMRVGKGCYRIATVALKNML